MIPTPAVNDPQGIEHLHNRDKNFLEKTGDPMQGTQPAGGWWLWILEAGKLQIISSAL